jgi:F-type H+-transporting ATPase subunit b
MSFEAEFWVAIAFVIFVGVLIKAGVHRQLFGALDHRGAQIKNELDEARRLRDEAEALLGEYQNKRADAEREAQSIISNAKVEGDRLTAEAAVKIEEFVARRTQMAETKIAQAEAQGLAEVRAAAAEAAVAAAEKILAEAAKGKIADNLIAQGIKDLKAKFN